MKMVDHALAYAKRGWFVFPTREKPSQPFEKDGEKVVLDEKTPYPLRGLDEATTDPNKIQSWWARFPNAMIGVNAGLSGLFCIDLDTKNIDKEGKKVNGVDNYAKLGINDGGALHSRTPSGGIHIIFTGKGKSSASKAGIDTRGEGGYFIAPPSSVLIGKNPGEYKALDDWNRTPAPLVDRARHH